MPEVIPAYIFIAVFSFVLGQELTKRTTIYRMGMKIHDNVLAILDKRTFVGDTGAKIIVSDEWEFEGHKMRMSIEQDPREPLDVTDYKEKL